MFLPVSAIPLWIDWLIHHVAYVENLQSLFASNFFAALITPSFPNWIKSPNETKVYEVYIDGDGISDTYKKNNMLEIIVVDDIAHIRKIRTWEKYITEVKE